MTSDEKILALAAEWRRLDTKLNTEPPFDDTKEDERIWNRLFARAIKIERQIVALRPTTAEAALTILDLFREEEFGLVGAYETEGAALDVLRGLLVPAAA
jgi:hypothetical protein